MPKTKIEDASKQTKFAPNQILCGDAFSVLSDFPEDVIDCTITSPPYFKQRNYEAEFQIGRESTPEAYIENLQAVFAEVFRVTKDSGSLWVVIGDKYINGELMGMPWRFAFSMMEIGWKLRSDIIWQKPNAMPSPVKTRPTVDHEYIFFFTKTKTYFYDADAIREPHVTFSEDSKMKGGRKHFGKRGGTPEEGKNSGNNNLHDGRWDQAFHPKGRNKRTVWSIPLSKFREAHFAVFPTKLVENCVLAGSPKDGCILDPFSGSGTTCLVAKDHHRNFIGIDASEKYCEMARKRLATS